MTAMSRTTRQMSWHGQRRRVSVLAEMALRQEKVSERLRELRERQGLSQEDAARKVGITHRQWQRWESGESMPYPRNLDTVASAFGITVAEFFDEDIAPAVDPVQLDRIESKLDELLQVCGALDVEGTVTRLGAELRATGGLGEADPPRADKPRKSGGRKATPRAPARGKRRA